MSDIATGETIPPARFLEDVRDVAVWSEREEPAIASGSYHILRAFTTVPSGTTEIAVVVLIVVLYAVSVAIWVKSSGFVKRDLSMPSNYKQWGDVIRTLFAPATVEELFWRVTLLPAPEKFELHSIPLIIFVTGCYICSHIFPAPLILNALPGKAWLPGGLVVFRDPRFIVAVILLATATVTLYYGSGGSIWPSILIHWLTVAVWLACFKGKQDLENPNLKPDDIWSFRAPGLQKIAGNLVLVVGLSTVTAGYFLSHESGVPMISHMFIAENTRLFMQIGSIVAIFLTVVAFCVSQYLCGDRRHICGIVSSLCMAVSILSPACVEKRGLKGFLHLFLDGIGCVLHVSCVVTSLGTALLDMWLQWWWQKPLFPEWANGIRCTIRWVCTITFMCQPIVRICGLPVNPYAALCEWIVLLGMWLYTWTSRFEFDGQERAYRMVKTSEGEAFKQTPRTPSVS